MPKGKKPSLTRGHGVILEEMRSQNRATIEAVEKIRVSVEQRMDRFEHDTVDRFTVLEAAVRQNSADSRKNSDDLRQNTVDIRQNGEDIRALSARVDALGSLDRRVSALEQ